VGIARKGGVTAAQVINTRDLEEIQAWLKQPRGERTRL
jgi:hypothetical protein